MLIYKDITEKALRNLKIIVKKVKNKFFLLLFQENDFRDLA
jgi:hypothetical protein